MSRVGVADLEELFEELGDDDGREGGDGTNTASLGETYRSTVEDPSASSSWIGVIGEAVLVAPASRRGDGCVGVVEAEGFGRRVR